VKKKMLYADLFEKRTLQGLLDELDAIEPFETPEHDRLLGEIAKKQEGLYALLGVKFPRYKFRNAGWKRYSAYHGQNLSSDSGQD
jgi:hypothetical protein